MKRATFVDIMTAGDVPISIHALVKRATAEIERMRKLFSISIHALVKRATITLQNMTA